MTTEPREVEIVALGAQGDGVAETPDGPLYVAFALPGERWRVADGERDVLLRAHSARATPLCRHFGTCGGCVAQHMPDALYVAWKRGIVVEAFRQRGLEAEIGPLKRVPPGSRRRAVLTARREGKGIVLGYHQRRGHALVDIAECPVLVPEIVARLGALRAIAAATAAQEARLTVLATPTGLDVTIVAPGTRPGAHTAAVLARLAAEHRLARITVAGETIVEQARPMLETGGVAVLPPPGAFVQAVAESVTELVEAVLAGVGKAKRVADLFCGIGTFTFPLARLARVLAVDSDAPALAALADAARRTQGLKPIETKVRDLFRMPLAPRELEGLDAVVFDPARSGAQAQAEQLARSKVATVVAVSCNPGTLARDVRILVDGGYAIERVTPIDQFLFSAHVEAVAVLRR